MASAAIVGAAVIGGAASMSAADKQSKAYKDASNAELQLQREAYENAEKELRPYVVEGNQARGMYNSAYGVAPADGDLATERAAYDSAFEASPFWQDAQYSTAEALNAMKSSNAALGKGSAVNSGKALRAASDITQGYRGAATQNFLSGLGGIADTGYSASTGIASAGQNYANQSSSAIRAGTAASAQAQAEGTANAAGFLGWGAGQLANTSQPASYFTPGPSYRPAAITPYTPQTVSTTPTYSPSYNFGG